MKFQITDTLKNQLLGLRQIFNDQVDKKDFKGIKKTIHLTYQVLNEAFDLPPLRKIIVRKACGKTTFGKNGSTKYGHIITKQNKVTGQKQYHILVSLFYLHPYFFNGDSNKMKNKLFETVLHEWAHYYDYQTRFAEYNVVDKFEAHDEQFYAQLEQLKETVGYDINEAFIKQIVASEEKIN